MLTAKNVKPSQAQKTYFVAADLVQNNFQYQFGAKISQH